MDRVALPNSQLDPSPLSRSETMPQSHRFKRNAVAIGFFLAGQTVACAELQAQDSTVQITTPSPYLITPNSSQSLKTRAINQAQLESAATLPEIEYSQPVPDLGTPRTPGFEAIADPYWNRNIHWTGTKFNSSADTRYVSERVSGFNDIPQCYLSEKCESHVSSFGDSIYSAFSQQISNGSASLMTLYNYDFYPLGTERQAEISVRGKYQIQKIVDRLQFTSADIKLQATGDQILDSRRQANVIALLTDYGISNNQVVLYHTYPGRSALEMKAHGLNLLNSVELRGRTVQSSGTASFSGSATFGQ